LFGIILIHKEAGKTSHDVVDSIRKVFGTRRVGHAGTLDPLATGLLVVAVGPATRFLQYLPLEPKEYVAEITFGRATSTYDLEGETTQEASVPQDLAQAIERARPAFLGLISQMPPMFSAVKVDGKPLYKYARQGREVARTARSVHIESFELSVTSPTSASARIVCSGGTYIRSLAHDLGQAMGCGAHLAKLHRTRVGRFAIEQSCRLTEAQPELLIPLKDALYPMPLVQLDERQVEHIREGRQIEVLVSPGQLLVGLQDQNGDVFSVARVQGHVLQPECVIPSEAFNGVS
jgi:tRNA pseudouridine55 synthase